MPLPTTFAGTSARGEGLFARLLTGITYRFADINNTTLAPSAQSLGINNSCSIGTDSLGNVYVLASEGSSAFVLIKYNSSYVIQWQKFTNFGSKNLYVDSAGNCYVPGSNFLTKFDTSGTFQWSVSLTGGTYITPTIVSVTTDSSGNVYLTGLFYPYRTGNLRIGYTYYYGAYVTKLDSTGALQWTSVLSNGASPNSIGAVADYSGKQIVLDSSGNIYVSAVSTNTGTGTNSFLWGINSSGTTIIQKQFYDSSYSFSSGVGGGIAIDPTNSYLYISWQYSGSVIGTGIVRYNLSSATFDKYSITSSYTRLASPYQSSVVCDSSGNVYLSNFAGNTLPITSFNSDLSSVLWQKIGTNGTHSQDFLISGYLTYNSLLGLLICGASFNSAGGTPLIFGNVPLNGSKSGNYTISPSIGGTTYATFQSYSTYALVSLTGTLSSATISLSSGLTISASAGPVVWSTTTNYATSTVVI